MNYIISDGVINIIFLSADNILEFQHLIEPLLNILEKEYAGDFEELVTDDRSWFLAIHPTYGIAGGLCLSPPHTQAAVSYQNKPVFEFYQTAHKHWLASHLFFSSEELEAQLSDTELIDWHSNIFRGFYHALIDLSLIGKLSTLGILIDQDQYANLNHGQIPFLYEQHINLNNQPFVFSYLTLPSEDKEEVYELAFGTQDMANFDSNSANKERHNVQVLH